MLDVDGIKCGACVNESEVDIQTQAKHGQDCRACLLRAGKYLVPLCPKLEHFHKEADVLAIELLI